MPGLNQTGPVGQGPMTGRGMGRCHPANPAQTQKTNEEMKRAIAGLIAVVIVGVSEMVWSWIKERRLKGGLK
jgi:hypothetical protein